MKKIIAVVLMLSLMVSCFVGCAKKDNTSSLFSAPVIVSESENIDDSQFAVNPLTGTKTMDKSALKLKPVAIMINNVSTAWPVQASLSKADVVYETYVEGGITRLLAVFKDIRTVGSQKIGSLRSGRYSYVDLALGHGAQFVHAGLDEDYCLPHIREVGTTTVDLNTDGSRSNVVGGNSCAERISNGLSWEHTLYTTGKDLYKKLKSSVGLKLSNEQENWMNFVEEGKEYTPDGGKAENVVIPFSGSYCTAEFKYDKEDETYYKYRNGTIQGDYGDKDAKINFENVLALYSDVTYFPDNKHVKTHLESGTGYYISRGGYKEIKWSKGAASEPLKITDSEGNEIDYNSGRTYVCFTRNSNKSSTTFQ